MNEEIITRFAEEHGLPRTVVTQLVTAASAPEDTIGADAPAGPAAEPTHTHPEGYTDLGSLGAGGMGEVRKVLEHDMGRTLAMKICPPSMGKEGIKRFIAEARITARLQHPNIPPVHALRESEGRLFYTLRYIAGSDLRTPIAEVHAASGGGQWRPGGAWTLRRLVEVLRQVCLAVEYAHQQGVLHRDLKPDNIMVGSFGEVYVIDWGVARQVDKPAGSEEPPRPLRGGPRTRAGAVIGTPGYLSPEQAAGRVHEIDPRSDVYGLGATLFHILCGHAPYTGSAEQRLEAVKGATAPPDLESPAPLPEELVSACQRAVMPNPRARFPSAAEFAQALTWWLEGVRRREQAEEALEEARESLERREALLAQRAAARATAERLLEREGIASANGWARWENAQKYAHRAALEELTYERHLWMALTYDSELTEARQWFVAHLQACHGEAVDRRDSRAAERLRFRLSTLQPEQESEALAAPSELERWWRQPPLVGRGAMVASVGQALTSAEGSLLNLVGPAGVGKTRLAVEIAWRHHASFPGGAFFCELEAATTPERAEQIIRGALSLEQSSVELGHALALVGPVLLVLDNLEQLQGTLGPSIARWLTQAPGLRVLATSRSRLDVVEERAVEVTPMSLLEGIELFVQQSRRADPVFTFTSANRGRIGALVEHLERLPLSIELAAARLKALSFHQLSQRLEDRLGLLGGLESAIADSWDLLDGCHQVALTQCTVFRGGFDLEAAEAVIELSGWEGASSVLDALTTLHGLHLLLSHQREDGTARYSLLASIREFAVRELAFPWETSERHARYYAALGERSARAPLGQAEGQAWYRRVSREQQNLLEGARDRNSAIAVTCALAALEVYNQRGPYAEGIALADTLLEREEVSELLRGRLLYARGVLRSKLSQLSRAMEDVAEAERRYRAAGRLDLAGRALVQIGTLHKDMNQLQEADAAYRRGLTLSREFEDWSAVGSALADLGTLLRRMDRLDGALETLNEALEMNEACEDLLEVSRTHLNIGNVLIQKGCFEEARAALQRALEGNQRAETRLYEASTWGTLGALECRVGCLEAAESHLRTALEMFRELGDPSNVAWCLGSLGWLHNERGEHAEAEAAYLNAIEQHRALGMRRSEALTCNMLGSLYAETARPDAARESLETALSIWTELKDVRGEGSCRGALSSLCRGRGELEDAWVHLRRGEALLRTLEASPELGSLLCHKVLLLQASGDEDGARRTLSEVEALAEKLRVGPNSMLRRGIREVRETLPGTSADPPAESSNSPVSSVRES